MAPISLCSSPTRRRQILTRPNFAIATADTGFRLRGFDFSVQRDELGIASVSFANASRNGRTELLSSAIEFVSVQHLRDNRKNAQAPSQNRGRDAQRMSDRPDVRRS
jgi:hypothetical protein